MDAISFIIFFISMMAEGVDSVIMKKVNMESSKIEETLFESDEDSPLQCAQRCKFIDSDAVVDFRNSRCRCMKYRPVDEPNDELENQGTLTELFVPQRVMKMPKIDGGFSSWKNLTNCTESCGNGILRQFRQCDSPRPENGGAECNGIKKRIVECNTHKCPPVINVALNKAAGQSSTLSSNQAYRAIDGSMGTWSITKFYENQWWNVDLENIYDIVYMVFKGSTYEDYNKALIIETRKKQDDVWIKCFEIGKTDEKNLKFKCTKLTSARYVKIRSTKRCSIVIYEFEVYALDISPTVTNKNP